ncbi:aldehyde-activating protein [Cellvibrio zantedeschiae]|uniref:Aldehyde-activating protein n=1 Tax=Cellvibrio zantedeschiae TaxID=1237077 RepID=A0ABQ3BB21_9GAMM|nr:GFA family protein [Cellvibrio zantedeschiae]GGY88517.1 aldehyde-activating protein [Cellvibrio zantedeschiae]
MNETITARCQCGAVKFTANSQPLIQFVCHCKDCQTAAGQPFVGLVFFKRKYADISGELSQHKFVADSGKATARDYCVQCDTVMFDHSEGFPGIIGVMQERILGDFEFLPHCHVWVKSKLDEIVIPEGATQYQESLIL